MNKTRHSLALSLISLLLCFSMLLGTTWAWFTDSVTSANNRIQTGTLDVELEYYVDGDWEKVTETTNVFEKDALWEPGHTEVVYLKISNLGSLALKYDFSINVVKETVGTNAAGEKFLLSDHIRYGVDHGKTPEYAGREEAVDAVSASSTPLKTAYSKKASMKSGDPEAYVALVVYMPESVGNEANAMKGTDAPVINLGISVMATQYTVEDDSFGTDYDEGAFFPDSDVDVSVTAPVKTDADNKVTEAVDLGSSDNVSAVVSKDTLLEAGTDFLTLSVTELETTNGNITVDDGEETRSVDVHVDGIAEGNTVPVIVSVKKLMPAGLNMGNYTLYHVEKGTPVAMTYVTATPVNHNEFTYDPATGDVVIALCSFSEVAVVAETAAAWEGNYNYDWYVEPDKAEYIIANADQLAGFGKIVGGMAEGIEIDAFAGSTVKLVADVNLGDAEDNNDADKIFYPIGYYNSNKNYDKVSGVSVTSDVSSFEGTFDGNGHKISNFYQNTWEMFGDYNDGYSGTPNHYKDAMGLFGYVLNGTVKNLTVDNFSSDGEFTPTGVIAAYACNSTFENIAITNCNPRVYNTGNGGIVGIGGNSDDPDTYKLNFNNITIDNTNKITALWGSWDVACGGLVGMFRGAGHVNMTKCHVAAQIDAYNDVCGNYQYYWYRYSGMLVGTNKNMTTDDKGYTVPETDKFHAENCTVHFDKWNDYYYCELVANSLASYTHDHQFSRLELVDSVDAENMKYTTLDGAEKDISTSGRVNFVTLLGGWETENATCYHFVDGEVWEHSMAGTEVVNGETVDVEDKQHVYLPFNQLFTGYGWGVKHIPVGEFGGVDILDREVAESLTKFSAKYEDNTYRIGDGCSVEIGELFEALEGADINVSGVWVSAEAVGGNTVVSELEVNKTDWRKSLLTINGTGTVKLTVQDYDYCVPTTLTIKVESIVLGSDDENTKIVGLSARKTYEYAPVTVLDTWDWQDVPAGSTEIDVDAGLWAVRLDGTTDCEYILVGETDMKPMYIDEATGKYTVNVYMWDPIGWIIGKWNSDMTSDVGLFSSATQYTGVQLAYNVPLDEATMDTYAHELLNFKYANSLSEIIPIDRLKTIKFSISGNGTICNNIWEDKTANDYTGIVRVYVADSTVADGYYDIEFAWSEASSTYKYDSKDMSVNFKNLLPSDANGYVTGIAIYPFGGIPNGWSVRQTDGSRLSYSCVKLYPLVTSTLSTAPDLYLVGDAYDGKYEIAGFDDSLSYAVSTDLINYKSIGSGFTTYKVSDTGTYYFKVEATDTTLESTASSVVIEGERETVQGLAVGENNTVDLGSDTVYEWAKYTHAGYGEWTRVEAEDERVLTLTDGLTAIRLPAQENKAAGKPQFLYVAGANVGSIGLEMNSSSRVPVTGAWVNSKNLYSSYGFPYQIDSGFSFGMISGFYQDLESSKDAYYTYTLAENEILPIQDVGCFSIIVGSGNGWFFEGAVTGKMRFHVADGLQDYYDIDFTSTKFNSEMSFDIGSVIPENETGYFTGISIWPMYEVLSGKYLEGKEAGNQNYILRIKGIYVVDGWTATGTDADKTDVTRCRIRISK